MKLHRLLLLCLFMTVLSRSHAWAQYLNDGSPCADTQAMPTLRSPALLVKTLRPEPSPLHLSWTHANRMELLRANTTIRPIPSL